MVLDRSERTVHHLVVDDSGIILSCSETDLYKTFTGQAQGGSATTLIDKTLPAQDYFSGYELEILTGPNSGNKIKIASYNKLERKITVKDPFPFPITEKTFYRVIKRVKSYIRYNNGIKYKYLGWEASAKLKEYLKLADVYVNQTLSPKDIQVYDIRVHGGGLKESEIQNALGLQDEVFWYWDIGNWDGESYPGMNAMVVNLPRSILKEAGGNFEREEVKDLVYKHVADGSYLIIKYYDKSTEIIKVEPGNKKAKIEWHQIDATQYNVYFGNDPENLTLYRTQPGHRNYIVLENLENNSEYYIQIEPIIKTQTQTKSKIVGFVPFGV